MKKLLVKVIPILILLITVSSVNAWTNLPIGNATMWAIVYALMLIIFVKSRIYFFNKENKPYTYIVFIFLAWNIICIIRGMLVAENYWEWKNLMTTSMFLLLPLSIYVTTNKLIVQRILTIWLKYALPAFFIFLIFIHGDAIGQYLVPVSFLFLFFPVLKIKWKLVLIFFTLVVIVSDLGARSNVIKFTIPIFFASIYYFRLLIGKKLLETVRLVIFAVPLVLFGLGVTGVFNVFKMDEYIEGDYTSTSEVNGEENEQELLGDTRTFIYVEVLESAIKNNYIFLGRTPARGNDSKSFGSYLAYELKTGKMERFANEVSILNVFTWTGIIGVILHFLLFFKATYLAINKSNNIFIKIIGLYLAFRWAYGWVEDFSTLNLNTFFLWVSLGICFSKSFRAMSNKEFTLWVRGIFDKRYRKLEYFINQRKIEWLLKK